MSYTVKVRLTAPLALEDVCAKVGKAFDPDVGGEKSFFKVWPQGHTEETPLAPLHLETQFYATPDFAAALPHLIASASLLHQSCVLDFETRWPDWTPPTLKECEAFCKQATLEVFWPQPPEQPPVENPPETP